EPSHFGPGTDDDPGHVVAENQRQAIGQNVFELAVPNLGIQLVYTGCVDLDQYIIVPDFRFRHFAETYCALAFITIDDECLHGLVRAYAANAVSCVGASLIWFSPTTFRRRNPKGPDTSITKRMVVCPPAATYSCVVRILAP